MAKKREDVALSKKLEIVKLIDRDLQLLYTALIIDLAILTIVQSALLIYAQESGENMSPVYKPKIADSEAA